MATLSPKQIYALARDGGFDKLAAVYATAVALAESSGRTDAVGDGGASIGLWQVHMPSHPEYSRAQLMDPRQNAKAAHAIYRAAGNRFTPWTMWKNGGYKQFMSQASDASSNIRLEDVLRTIPGLSQLAGSVQGARDAASGVADATGAVVQGVNKFNAWITTPANWVRVAYVIAGIGLVVGAAIVLAVQGGERALKSPAGRTATKVATKGVV